MQEVQEVSERIGTMKAILTRVFETHPRLQGALPTKGNSAETHRALWLLHVLVVWLCLPYCPAFVIELPVEIVTPKSKLASSRIAATWILVLCYSAKLVPRVTARRRLPGEGSELNALCLLVYNISTRCTIL